MLPLALLTLAFAAPTTPAGPPSTPPQATVAPAGHPDLVEAARKYLGRLYLFGGRDQQLDCMGLVFRAWQDAGRGEWSRLSVNPTELVAKRSFGAPVPGLDGVTTSAVRLTRFAPGDVIFFLGYAINPAEPAMAQLPEGPAWVWHMGMYAGEGKFIVGDHYAGRVVEEPLLAYLSRHDNYVGVFVVRPT